MTFAAYTLSGCLSSNPSWLPVKNQWCSARLDEIYMFYDNGWHRHCWLSGTQISGLRQWLISRYRNPLSVEFFSITGILFDIVNIAWYVMSFLDIEIVHVVNLSPPSATYMHQWTWSSLVQVMACCLFGANPLPDPMLLYCQLDYWEQISVKFESEFCHFHSRKCIWNCRLTKWQPFFQGEMS